MNRITPLLLALITTTAILPSAYCADPPAAPESVGMSAAILNRLDEAVELAIGRQETPGAVLLVECKGTVVWHKAYGHRQTQPEKVPMTVDTVFDMASLTKTMATATSMMLLVEQGKVHVEDPVVNYLPDFGQNGKEEVTVEQLLTHRAGFVPDNALADYDGGREKAIERIYALEPIYEPGTRFVYSDVGYIVLGEIIKQVTGQRVDEFSRKHVFEPLRMHETCFLPGDQLKQRAAPTEQRDGQWMVGQVHDPRAFRMGGVAGHAGLFSTAADVARFARMMLGQGRLGGVQLLKPQTVQRMTCSGDLPPNERRGLGWDIDTRFSSERGDLFPIGGYGHTGFTGTSLWIDPGSESFVILLSNRVHPDGNGNVVRLRRVVASTVAASILAAAADPGELLPAGGESPITGNVLTGIDVARSDGFKALAGRNVGLITNHTGRARDGATTIDLLHEAPNVNLVALFSPEHGIRGVLDSTVDDSRDEKTGLHIYSLYGTTRRPTADMLRGIDTLVFDIQDIGTRFYTFLSTLLYAMEEAARHGIGVIVLDRPNPIGADQVAGPVLDAGLESFVGYYTMPVRHGMTAGELARLFNEQRRIGCKLTVVTVENWRRGDLFDATGLTWINPSPNMRNLNEALLYPGIGLLETTNVSVGRGTGTPFEVLGAPWIDGQVLAAALNARRLSGVRFVPIRFTPDSSTHRGKECGGVNILITGRDRFEPLRTGIEIAYQLRKLYGDQWTLDRYLRLLANQDTLDQLKGGATPEQIEAGWQQKLQAFRELRQSYLIYR